MRRYKEGALVKNGNAKTWYFVCDLMSDAEQNKPKFSMFDSNWQLIPADTFKELVKNGQVEHLVLEGNTIKYKWSDEEKRDFYAKVANNASYRGTGLADREIADKEKSFVDGEVVYEEIHIKAAQSGMGLAVCWSDVRVHGRNVCAFVFGSEDLRRKLLDTYASLNPNWARNYYGSCESNNVCTLCIFDYSDLTSLYKVVEQFNCLSTTTIMKRYIKKAENGIKVNEVVLDNLDERKKFVNKIDGITKRVEKKLSVRR